MPEKYLERILTPLHETFYPLEQTVREFLNGKNREEIALKRYRKELSSYDKNQFQNGTLEYLLEEKVDIPYQVDSKGRPKTSQEGEKAQNFVLENPAEAAFSHYLIKRAAREEMDVQEFM